MKNQLLLSFLFLFLTTALTFAQQFPPQGGGEVLSERTDKCLSDEERAETQLMIRENVRMLTEQGILSESSQRNSMIVSFIWPMQNAAGFPFYNGVATNNFVDQNTGGGLLDYDCGARTYNGHRGTDIDTWPFPWYIYDNDYVEVIAGAPGVIVAKTDGNADDHCSCSGTWNAVFVQHSDGSTAWYGHLKNGSLTSKTIGQSVAGGEYLGVVASSGCSTQPHLHFEVYDGSNNLVDPYTGTCNTLNTQSWWAGQPGYRNSFLNALLTHDAVPVHGCPGGNEVPHFMNSFVPGETVYTAFYYSDQQSGQTTTMRLRKPDGSLWNSWSHTSGSTYTKSWWYWSWNLPTSGPFGSWTLEATYEGATYAHSFDYLSGLPVELLDFSGRLEADKGVLLQWRTASETDNYGFEVEHSLDARDWRKIGFINGNGQSLEVNHYQQRHLSPAKGINYYRLRQMDFGGDFEYSEVISVNNEQEGSLELFPNPSTGRVDIGGVAVKDASLEVLDIHGRTVRSDRLYSPHFDLSGLPKGTYFIRLQAEGQLYSSRLLKM